MFCRTPRAPAGTEAPTAELPRQLQPPLALASIEEWGQDIDKGTMRRKVTPPTVCAHLLQRMFSGSLVISFTVYRADYPKAVPAGFVIPFSEPRGVMDNVTKKEKKYQSRPKKPKAWDGWDIGLPMVVPCHVLSVVFLAEQLQGHFLGHPNPIFSTFFNFKVMPKNHYPDKGMRTTRLYHYYYYCWFYYYCCCCSYYCFHVTIGHSETGGRNLNKHPT